MTRRTYARRVHCSPQISKPSKAPSSPAFTTTARALPHSRSPPPPTPPAARAASPRPSVSVAQRPRARRRRVPSAIRCWPRILPSPRLFRTPAPPACATTPPAAARKPWDPGPRHQRLVRDNFSITHFEGDAAGAFGAVVPPGPASRVERFDAPQPALPHRGV